MLDPQVFISRLANVDLNYAIRNFKVGEGSLRPSQASDQYDSLPYPGGSGVITYRTP